MMTTTATASQNSSAMPPKRAPRTLFPLFCRNTAKVDIMVRLLVQADGRTASISVSLPNGLTLYTEIAGFQRTIFSRLRVADFPAPLQPSLRTPARSSLPRLRTGQNRRALPESRKGSLQAQRRNFPRAGGTLRLRRQVACGAG